MELDTPLKESIVATVSSDAQPQMKE